MPKSKMHNNARALRKTQTPAEQLLWSKLRSRQLSGFKFRRQHPVTNFILDFYCREAHLAVEIDGGQHAIDEECKRDNTRTDFLNEMGIQVIRFWNHEVLENLDDVVTAIDDMLNEIMAGNKGDACQ